MAELSEDDKNRISHRALAVKQLRKILIRLVNERLDEAERIAG
jgi:inosine/xanthosine triphosphate pyrophosphatase family protein